MKNTKYNCKEKFRVFDKDELQNHLTKIGKLHYVYLLCYPPLGDFVLPFYVGIGKGDSIFRNEKEAKTSTIGSLKIEVIRQIEAEGKEILRFIDGFYDQEPWQRKQELLNEFGLRYNNTGILTNMNTYAESHKIDNVELRKYAAEGNNHPSNFIKRYYRLKAGPNKPSNPNSIYGKIYSILDKNPGITGEDLVEILLEVDFSENKSAYTQTGQVSRPWLAKYIDGGFYEKNKFIQLFV